MQRPWRSRSASSVNAASPLVVGDQLFVSAEYGPGAGVFQMGDATLTERVPMREIDQMFRGRLAPAEVLAARPR